MAVFLSKLLNGAAYLRRDEQIGLLQMQSKEAPRKAAMQETHGSLTLF
jgi:hypothetical protein